MYQSKFCGSTDRTQVDFRNEAAFQKTADPTLMSAYVQCKQVEGKGLETQFNESPNHHVFTVTMRYNKPFETGGKPRLKSIDFKPAASVKCTGTIVPPMFLDANSNSMQCERLKQTELSVLINTDAGAFTRDLPAVTPPPSDEELVMAALPQGTILAWAAKKPLPTGWHLCNGQAGTPDLNDRSPIGTADKSAIGTLVGTPSHHHSGSGTALENITKKGWNANLQYEGNGDHTSDHTHPVTITTDEQPNLPPSTKIQFIMKL